MKKYFTILFLFVSFFAFSQNAGINFQGVGRNASGIVLATQKISLRFSVIQGSETGSVEYVESKEVTTNAQGVFSVVIGDGTQISKTGNFTDINWKINPKFLKVEMDPAGGTTFTAMGTTRLQSVPFAYYANGVNADNVDGVLSASKGGTGVASITALKTALGVDQIYTTAEKNKLAAISGTNTGDQDLSGLATISQLSGKANTVDLALKAPLESPTFTGTVSGITKAMIGLSDVENTADLAKPISSATQIALDSKVSTATFSTTVATKENAANKSTAIDLGASGTSDILFPTQKAVKTYVDSQINSGGVADEGITTIKLADAAVTDEKVSTGIDKAKVGLGNVDNTADVDKPISTATQEALDNKLDVSTAEAAFARVDQSNLFHRDQAIEGGLTANRINFPSLYNSYIEGFPIPLSDIDGLNINNDYFVSVGKTLVDDTKGWLFDIRNNKLLLPNGTQIQSGTNSSTIIQTRADTDFSIKTSTVDFENFEYGESDPREHELKYTADGKLRFSDGSRIFPYISDQEAELKDIFSIRSKTDGYIELKTTSEEQEYYWTFKDDGKITFPDRATTMGVTSNPGFSIFELISPNSISIFGGNRLDENGKFGSLSIYPTREDPESEDKYVIELVTSTDEVGYPNVWKYDSEGILTFPGGATLAGNYSGSTYFELKTSDENEGFKIITNNNPEFTQAWKFNFEGTLLFPDGTEMGEHYFYEEDISLFMVQSRKGIFLTSGDLNEEINKVASIGISPMEQEGKVIITTKEVDDQNFEISKSWTYDSQGLLTFPDGTTLAGNYSGSTYFELKTGDNDGLKITNSDDPSNPKTWKFDLEGKLTLPDGTITSGNISNTSNFGFDTSPSNSGFSIITAGTSSGTTQLWTLANDGSLKFPDGTIASGNISDTGNFGIDTRVTENGFSIITGNSSGVNQLWSFGSNGETVFPGNGKIGMNDDDNWNNALQINSPSALRIVTSTSQYDRTWHFTAEGNTHLPGSLFLNGNTYSGGYIYNSGNIFIANGHELKIGDYNSSRNALDNILKEQFTISNFNIMNPTNIIWTLQFDPRTINSVSIYINGLRISKSDYEKFDYKMIKYIGPANLQLNDRIQIDYQY